MPAMSSSVTSSLSRRASEAFAAAARSSAALICFSMPGMMEKRSSPARSRSDSRSALSSFALARSRLSRRVRVSSIACFSASHAARSALICSLVSANSFSSSSRRIREPASFSFFRAESSISMRMAFRSSSSISVGQESISVRSLAAASSIRSIALSGRKRSAMYLSERVAAATMAASRILTPWCSS